LLRDPNSKSISLKSVKSIQNGSLTNNPKFPSINQLSKDANLASKAKASLHEMGNSILSV